MSYRRVWQLTRQLACLITAVFLSAAACAQGFSEGSGNTGYGNQSGQYYVEEMSYISINDSLDVDAYAEVDAYDDGEIDTSLYSLYVDLTITMDGVYQGSDSDLGNGNNASTEANAAGVAGHQYGLEADFGLYYYIVEYGDAYNEYGSLGSEWEQASTAPPAPNVDSVSPTSGNIGDSQQPITFYGENLLNSAGSVPYFTAYPSGLSVTALYNDPVSGAASSTTTLYGTYTINQGTLPNAGLIDLFTDAGSSNDINFSTDSADATITDITPSTWQADGNQFSITITGSNFGNHPTIHITDPSDITYGSNPTVNGDGSLTTTVTVPSSETATQANLYVQPGSVGCTGNCWTSSDPQDQSGQSSTNTIAISLPTCPQSITLSQTWEQPLALDDPPWLTGVGILTLMQLGPAGANLSLVTITENVTPLTNLCPANIQQYSSFPTITDTTSSPFPVGSPPGGTGAWESFQLPGVPNAFYDSHRLKLNFNMLGLTTQTSCTATASQVYKCNGVPFGQTYILTNHYSSGIINGQPVTYVDVTKQ